jgi:hypothetical protein
MSHGGHGGGHESGGGGGGEGLTLPDSAFGFLIVMFLMAVSAGPEFFNQVMGRTLS